jgi:hypothetical protein
LLLENREVYIRAASDLVQDKITLLLEELREVALDPEKPFVRTPQNVGSAFLDILLLSISTTRSLELCFLVPYSSNIFLTSPISNHPPTNPRRPSPSSIA